MTDPLRRLRNMLGLITAVAAVLMLGVGLWQYLDARWVPVSAYATEMGKVSQRLTSIELTIINGNLRNVQWKIVDLERIPKRSKQEEEFLWQLREQERELLDQATVARERERKR